MEVNSNNLEKKSRNQSELWQLPHGNGRSLNPGEIEAVFDSTPAGIGIIKNRVLCWTNNNLCSMLGYESNCLIGKNTRNFYTDRQEYDRVGIDLYSKLDKHDKGLVETKLVKKDGTFLHCRIRVSRLDKQDPLKGFIFVITDISELKILQIQLQQAQKMEAIGVLAGGISHDFNNILMGIQGHLSLMQIDINAVEKVKSHTKHIGRLVKTAADLTKHLLGFARGGKYKISTLNINELIPLSLKIFAPTRKDIVVHECYDEYLHLVDADHTQFEQVFLNLLINASQAMPEQGDIFIKTQNRVIDENHEYPFEVHPGPYIKVTIKDTGIGMDQETQARVFDPFFSTKGTDDKKGRGLGLSTVYGIVKNHDGFILVDSNIGEGTSFHVWLPKSDNYDVQETVEESHDITQRQGESETILLVDDEEEVVNIGKNFLEELGYKPLVARDGFEAVEIFKIHKDKISLVVLDLIMPGMNGSQVFVEIKKIQENSKILISTGYTVDDKIKDLLNQGCQGFIQKPFSLNEFSHTLRKILDKT